MLDPIRNALSAKTTTARISAAVSTAICVFSGSLSTRRVSGKKNYFYLNLFRQLLLENIIMDLHNETSRIAVVEELLNDLKSATDTKKSCALHNRVTSILIHDKWYSSKQQDSVVAGAKASFGLTRKQKKLNLPDVRDESDYEDEGYNYEGHDYYGSYD
jgi:hypothetical protein